MVGMKVRGVPLVPGRRDCTTLRVACAGRVIVGPPDGRDGRVVAAAEVEEGVKTGCDRMVPLGLTDFGTIATRELLAGETSAGRVTS